MSCKNLVLDAGPLLSLSPIRGLAQTYFTTQQVLSELKDPRAREHFQKLGLTAGVSVQIKSPSLTAVSHVIQFAKKTGDYAVLSHADLTVLALTYELSEEAKKEADKVKPDSSSQVDTVSTPEADLISNQNPLDEVNTAESETLPAEGEDQTKEEDLEPLDVQLVREGEEPEIDGPRQGDVPDSASPPASPSPQSSDEDDGPIFDDPSSESDGEGEWITPANVGYHKSRAMDLLPSNGDNAKSKKSKPEEVIYAGCMTADFAMQNVLLQMGLNLVGNEGKRIERVKTWVLRCHACFKICKDNSKKFCPSCGNPTLLRASVTLSSPGASSDAPVMQIHLKSNFQYRNRGTKYPIPAPKSGTAKTGSGEGLILREDQTEYVRAKKLADGRKEREERKMVKGILQSGPDGGGVKLGSWMDPDWVPEMVGVGAGGKGRTVRGNRVGKDGMPVIGHGRKNPNERKRKA